MRLEVQALRALAVALVLGFHLWPEAVPGGYVGVDVFFVISGFLITAHLVREAERTRRVDVLAFWGRRARRLLPASLLVLVCCALATLALVPMTEWGPFLAEVRASALQVQNWHLAAEAVDYLAAAEDPSPVQHFWSLSAEEQVYLVWPLLMAAALLLARRVAVRTAIGALLAVVTAASLAYGVHRTAVDPAAAYFVTPARAWELGLGGLLAVFAAGPARHVVAERRRAVLSWAGLVAICVAAFAFDARTPFPGVAALLPTVGALAMIQAGMPVVRWSPARALALRPVQRLGDVSYSVYLWHWPLLIIVPLALAQPLGGLGRVGVLAATIALAAATKVLVEDPFRRGPLTRRPVRWTFATAAAGVVAVLTVSTLGTTHVDAEARKAAQRTEHVLAEPPSCFGAASRDPQRPCDDPPRPDLVVPRPVEARRTENAPCKRVERLACAFGVPAERARAQVALLGDSHAAHWRAALQVAAERRGWHALSVVRESCAFSTLPADLEEPKRSRCARWVDAVPRWFERHPEVRTVVVSQLSGRPDTEAQARGYLEAWSRLPDTVERIIVLRDPPKTRYETAACVERALERDLDAGRACAVPRVRYLDEDPAAMAVERVRGRRAHVVDLTAVFCGERTCPPVIGGALVYKDDNHLTLAFARTLGPLVDRRLTG